MRKPRKNYTPSEKVAILRRHLLDRVPVSDLCDEHQLSRRLPAAPPVGWPRNMDMRDVVDAIIYILRRLRVA